MEIAGPVTTLGAGVVFGLALAAPPGPMNALIAQESVLRGWRAGVRAGLGAMTADLCFFMLSLAGVVTALQRLPRLRAAMIVVGGVLMWYFAVDAVRGVSRTLAPDACPDASGSGFRKAFVLALTNPYQILFWLTVGIGLLAPGRLDLLARTPYVGEHLSGLLVVSTGTPALVVGLFAGIAVWVGGFPVALVTARRRLQRIEPAVAAVSALVLGGFGTIFLLDGLGSIL